MMNVMTAATMMSPIKTKWVPQIDLLRFLLVIGVLTFDLSTILVLSEPSSSSQKITYSICSSLVDNTDKDVVMCDAVMGGEDTTTMSSNAAMIQPNFNCSNTNNAMCIQLIRRSSKSLNRLECVSGLCDDENENDHLVNIVWGFNSHWIDTCDPTCNNKKAGKNMNNNNAIHQSTKTYDQRCLTTNDCSHLGEGFCCSLPSLTTLKAGGCGPPNCYACDTNDTTIAAEAAVFGKENNPSASSVCRPSESCPPLNFGTCIRTGVPDIRPGYSCANNPCLDALLWAEEVCGFHRWTQSFPSTLKTCSAACRKAMGAISDCSFIATAAVPTTTTIDLTARLASLKNTYQNYKGCRNCQDSYYYQQCTSTSDCLVGYCCSLPPTQVVPGFFDPSTSCGPPESCWCNATQIDSNSFSQRVTCTLECESPALGSCIEVGTVDPRNPLYSCDCSDPATFSRTASPTTMRPSKVPSTSSPSESPTTSSSSSSVTMLPTPEVVPSVVPAAPMTISPTGNPDGVVETPSLGPTTTVEEEEDEDSNNIPIIIGGGSRGVYQSPTIQSLIIRHLLIGWTALGFIIMLF